MPPWGRSTRWVGCPHGLQSAQANFSPRSGPNSSRRSPPLERDTPEEGDERREPGDFNFEGLYQDEFDAGRAQDLKDRLAALERAEERLADGTYGLSVSSGEPIPDGRLEVNPTAELTVDEQDPSSRASLAARSAGPPTRAAWPSAPRTPPR